MPEILITHTTVDDIKELVPLHMRTWLKTYAGLVDNDYLMEKVNPKNYETRIEKRTAFFHEKKKEGNIFLVAKINGRAVGFAEGGNLLNKDLEVDKEIWGLYVDPDFQEIGVGKALFNAFVEIVRAEGAKTMGIGCLRDNKKSIDFYKKMGGRVLKEGFWKYEKGELPETFFIYDI